MELSNKLTTSEIYPFIRNYIGTLLESHRNTPYYQFEVEPFDNFSQSQILEYLTNNKEDEIFLQEQFDFLLEKERNWDADRFKDDPRMNFVSNETIFRNKWHHFRMSVPLITRNGKALIMRVIYQNAFSSVMNGSDSIELFKRDESDRWEYAGALYSMSI